MAHHATCHCHHVVYHPLTRPHHHPRCNHPRHHQTIAETIVVLATDEVVTFVDGGPEDAVLVELAPFVLGGEFKRSPTGPLWFVVPVEIVL
jgi:hypothetical protein